MGHPMQCSYSDRPVIQIYKLCMEYGRQIVAVRISTQTCMNLAATWDIVNWKGVDKDFSLGVKKLTININQDDILNFQHRVWWKIDESEIN